MVEFHRQGLLAAGLASLVTFLNPLERGNVKKLQTLCNVKNLIYFLPIQAMVHGENESIDFNSKVTMRGSNEDLRT